MPGGQWFQSTAGRPSVSLPGSQMLPLCGPPCHPERGGAGATEDGGGTDAVPTDAKSTHGVYVAVTELLRKFQSDRAAYDAFFDCINTLPTRLWEATCESHLPDRIRRSDVESHVQHFPEAIKQVIGIAVLLQNMTYSFLEVPGQPALLDDASFSVSSLSSSIQSVTPSTRTISCTVSSSRPSARPSLSYAPPPPSV